MKRIRRYELHHFTKKRDDLPVVAREFFAECLKFTADNEHHEHGTIYTVGVLRAIMRHGVLKHTKKYAKIVDDLAHNIRYHAMQQGAMRSNIICAAFSFSPTHKAVHIMEVVDLAAPFDIPTDALYRELRALDGRTDIHVYGKAHTLTVSNEWFSIVPTPSTEEGGRGI